MTPEIFLILALAVFSSAIFSAVAGFGSGILIIVTFSFFFDIKTSVALASIIFLFNNLNKLYFFHKTVDWDFAKKIVLSMIPFCFLGLYFFKMFDAQIINYLMGGLGIFLILDHVLPFRKSAVIPNFSSGKIFLGGAVFGFFSGLGVGSLLKVFLLKSRGLSKEMFVGTGVIITLLLNLVKLPSFIYMDFVGASEIFFLLPLFFVNFVGTFFGKKILHKISHSLFEKIVLGMVLLASIKFLFF